ncbi:5'-AMP-activated protein kinase beta subunit, interation domain-containing protein [Chytriomyces sp. MP71]|nr:5'-AMP-activated protein kinase beta subunit, interation domain-containing protein [Chytriomyces sp. MP71]
MHIHISSIKRVAHQHRITTLDDITHSSLGFNCRTIPTPKLHINKQTNKIYWCSLSRSGSISSLFARVVVGGGANGDATAAQSPAGGSDAAPGAVSPARLASDQQAAVAKELAEKAYLNSARIVHNYGVGGIAPLAPLTGGQKKDDKSVIPVMVSWNGGGRVVHITGTFNNWKQKIRLTKSKTDFSTVIDMPAGETHRFKFIVDDEWKCSEDLPIASDSEGNMVNYLDIVDEFGDGIHDGFDGLAHDDNVTSYLGESPESSYASKIPQYLSWHLENQAAAAAAAAAGMPAAAASPSSASGRKSTPPPLPSDPPPHLPPHLEKVFLNLPVPVTSHRDDNLILPIPASVTLNHLYACSIRDGVMALSTTTRYKQKYVTTILYKPVMES